MLRRVERRRSSAPMDPHNFVFGRKGCCFNGVLIVNESKSTLQTLGWRTLSWNINVTVDKVIFACTCWIVDDVPRKAGSHEL